MRRSALLGTLLLLSGCSGLGHFFQDTVRVPGQNPNSTTGVSENLLRSRGETPTEDAILPQNGNVWPGPPQSLPTLSDVSRGGGQNGGDLLGSTGGNGGTMPRGGSMSLGEQSQIHGGAATNESGFSGGSLSDSVPDPAARFRAQHPQAPGGDGSGGGNNGGSGGSAGGGTGAGSNIVIPNGDGTSTVISPDGTVKTVKGTPK